jgi:hypothetical protein
MPKKIIRNGRYIDAGGVTRVQKIDDLPDESVHCYAYGHRWNDPLGQPAVGWDVALQAWETRFSCENGCGRTRREVIMLATGEPEPFQYRGGTMLFSGSDFPKRFAKVEWISRKRRNAARRTKRTTAEPAASSG